MKKYNIGLDFGTYQSKACIYSLGNATHEFFRFANGTFFLPSIVCKHSDGRLTYGDVADTQTDERYSYFKMAAAEDVEFHAETYGTKSGGSSYRFNEFKSYTPEFLSVVYLTFILLTIKEKYRSRPPKTKLGGLLSRLLRKESESGKVVFTVQLGIPTEWSQKKNLRRKRKFENILVLSELLQRKYGALNTFVEARADELVSDVRDIFTSFNFPTRDAFYDTLNDMGLSVYPETAAGLTFIVKTKQLLPGYYAIMDIGGGTSDISFFRLLDGQKIRYLASESYMMAANNVYSHYCGNADSLSKLRKAEEKALSMILKNTWKSGKLGDSLDEVDKRLARLVYKLFHKRVYYYQRDMVRKYSNQPIILYGGGALLPIIKDGAIEIYDNGGQSLNGTYLEKQEIKQYTSIINILPKDKSWEKDFSLLVVALGLSYLHSIDDTDWFGTEEYRSADGDARGDKHFVAHPFNEGCYIYDVLASKWN